MRKGFLIYEEMRKYFLIYKEAVCHIWLCNCSILNFLIYEKNLIFFCISVRETVKLQSRGKHLLTWRIFYFVALRIFQQSSLRISPHPLHNLSFLQVAGGASGEQTAGGDAPTGGPSERKHRQACGRLQLSAGQQRWHTAPKPTLIKKKRKSSLYMRKFRCDRLKSNIWWRAS